MIQATFDRTFKLTSPGRILGSLYLYDADGMKSLDLAVKSADLTLKGDSAIGLSGDQEIVRPINWTVPPGMLIGTVVTLTATASDFLGLVAADTVHLVVQDTVPSGP